MMMGVCQRESEYSAGSDSDGIWKIPEDLLVLRIFMILPASSILAVRGVCKPWRRITTSPSFVRAHTRHHCDDVTANTKSMIVQCDDSPFKQYFRVDANTDTNQMYQREVEIVMPPNCNEGARCGFVMRACCDGLVCFQGYYSNSYYICNPVTKTTVTVPASSPRIPGCWFFLRGLYFHPPTNEYRLLQRFIEHFTAQATFVAEYKVATLKAPHPWRTVYELICVDGHPGMWNHPEKLDNALASNEYENLPVTASGNLHWLPTGDRQLGIVAFDTITEKFREMAAPTQCMPLRYPLTMLDVVGGNLCIGCKKNSEIVEMMDIWVMKDYQTQQWTKLHSVVSGGLGSLGMLPNGEDETKEEFKMLMRWWPSEKQISLCDFKRGAFFHLHISELDMLGRTHGYTESLVKL